MRRFGRRDEGETLFPSVVPRHGRTLFPQIFFSIFGLLPVTTLLAPFSFISWGPWLPPAARTPRVPEARAQAASVRFENSTPPPTHPPPHPLSNEQAADATRPHADTLACACSLAFSLMPRSRLWVFFCDVTARSGVIESEKGRMQGGREGRKAKTRSSFLQQPLACVFRDLSQELALSLPPSLPPLSTLHPSSYGKRREASFAEVRGA